MVKSILGTGPYVNDGMAVAESTMTCIMARESAYSGQEITWDQMMKSNLDLYPKSLRLRREDAGPAAAGAGRVQIQLGDGSRGPGAVGPPGPDSRLLVPRLSGPPATRATRLDTTRCRAAN